ncbi:hypothetical protein [Luteitalea sp.]|uniref:hypothetical protein n=1 Tax=Luteitalea sp. TaxID=2004800 RepID=UPI0025C1B17B|nr:hypothetical protein [Luteitalea sp.]
MLRHSYAGLVGALAVALITVSASTASAQTTTVTAAWDRNTDALTAGYVVHYGTSPGTYQWSYDAGSQVSAQLTLNRGSIYYFVVRAYNTSAQQGPPSNEATIDLRTTTAAPTAQITATLQGTNAIVSWQTTNATSATINGATVALSGTSTVPVTATATFTIVARNAAGTTATQSATVTVTPVPAPTATITASLQNSTTALVSWQTANAVSATINGVGVSLTGSASVAVATTTTFTIIATSSTGATVTRSATVTVAPPTSPLPGAPTNMTVAVSGSRATFAWQLAATGGAPTGYLIDLGLSGTTQMLASGYNVGNITSVAADLPRGRYHARVRATNAAGTSGYSNLFQFKIGRTLVSPRGFTVTWIGTTAVMSWTAASADGAIEDVPTNYVLEAGTAPGLADVATVKLGRVTSFSAPIPSGTYYVRLRAENDYGDSDPTPDLVLVPPGAPGAPNTLVASRVNSTVNLRWNAPAGSSVGGYIIEAGSAPGLSDLARVQVGTATTFSAQAPVGTYYIRVRAVNGRGPGLPSNEVLVR